MKDVKFDKTKIADQILKPLVQQLMEQSYELGLNIIVAVETAQDTTANGESKTCIRLSAAMDRDTASMRMLGLFAMAQSDNFEDFIQGAHDAMVKDAERNAGKQKELLQALMPDLFKTGVQK